ncbi:MAG: hypothetical protein JOY99_10625 [Sphingomonadaceae bacterium]|nr:hypothetical protein [Sphingomonadaceae bacterium]
MSEITKTSIDRAQADRPQRGAEGDSRPNPDGPDPRARRGQPPEKVEDRPSVGQVEPDDYPDKASGKNV